MVTVAGRLSADLQQPERAVDAIVQQAAKAVEEDHAEVICLGCGGMAELEAEARLHYSGQLCLARDFDSYELDAAGVLSKQPGKSPFSGD